MFKIKSDLINNNDKIVVGISGGADSICLTHILSSIKSKYNLKLYAVHVNHHLRGTASDIDEAFVRKFCDSLDIKLFVYDIKLEKDHSIEEKAREKRYEIFSDVCKKVGADKCALAHNSDDNVETILMWLIRGSGTKGLLGIPLERDIAHRIKVVRPLLNVSREEIVEYLNLNKLDYREDASNKDTKFFRNKIRHELIPFLENYNNKFRRHILNLSSIIYENEAFTTEIVKDALCNVILQRNSSNIVIDLKLYRSYNIMICRRILYELCDGVSYQQIQDILELIDKNEASFLYKIHENLVVNKEYDKLYINTKNIDYAFLDDKIDFKIGESCVFGQYKFDSKIIKLEDIADLKNSNKAFLNVDLIDNKKLCFRFWRRGDTFVPFGMKQEKKIHDFFIDEKIGKHKRQSLPILVCNDEIVWVSGCRISDKFKIDNKTKNVLLIEMRRISE